MAKRGKGRRMAPPGGPPGMMRQVQELQAKIAEAQEAMEGETVTVTVGGGAVTVVMTGEYKIESITMDPDLLDPDEVDMLQDLVTAAVNGAVEQLQGLAARRMSALTGGLRLPGWMSP